MSHTTRPAAPAEGNREARFRRLFEAYYRLVLAYALRRTGLDADAHDAVGETFTILWRRLEVCPEGENARAWLYGVARRCLANQRRGDGRRTRLAERLDHSAALDSDAVDGCEERADCARVLHAALARLKPADREILCLMAWEELSHAELATALGISTNAVGIRLHRARNRLRRILMIEGFDTHEDDL